MILAGVEGALGDANQPDVLALQLSSSAIWNSRAAAGRACDSGSRIPAALRGATNSCTIDSAACWTVFQRAPASARISLRLDVAAVMRTECEDARGDAI